MVEFGDQDISGLIEPEDSQKTDADIFIEEQKRKSEEKEDDSQKKKDAKIFGKIISGILVADALKYLIKQSKIIGMVLENIAKALGLLIDLLLMPFLPIIVWAIVGMYRAVLGIWAWWKEHIPSAGGTSGNIPQFEITSGGLKMAITDFAIALASALIAALTLALLAAAGVAAGWAVVAAAIVGVLTYAIGTYLADLAYKLGEYLGPLIYNVGKQFGDWVYNLGVAFGTWLQDVYNGIVNFINKGREYITDTLTSIPDKIRELFNKIYDTVVSAFKNVVNSIIWVVNQMFSALRGIPLAGAFIPGNIPYLDKGGKIEKTGIAVVHEGETVTPKGGGNTYNFYGYDDVALQKKIVGILRKGGAGYNV